jgi:serine/threonine-protein kinase RIM15
MERSLSEDIREAREDLKEAAEQTLNVIVDLYLDGRIKWVSPSWTAVIGTRVEDVEGKMIRDIILDNKTAFEDAIASMKQDDSRSRMVRFAVRTGPMSVFRQDSSIGSIVGDEETGDVEAQMQQESTPESDENILNLEGQGIMVFDRSSGDESHVSILI